MITNEPEIPKKVGNLLVCREGLSVMTSGNLPSLFFKVYGWFIDRNRDLSI